MNGQNSNLPLQHPEIDYDCLPNRTAMEAYCLQQLLPIWTIWKDLILIWPKLFLKTRYTGHFWTISFLSVANTRLEGCESLFQLVLLAELQQEDIAQKVYWIAFYRISIRFYHPANPSISIKLVVTYVSSHNHCNDSFIDYLVNKSNHSKIKVCNNILIEQFS